MSHMTAVSDDTCLNFEDYNQNVTTNEKGRRRIENKSAWDKTRKKSIRNSGAKHKPFVACRHNGKTNLCSAFSTLSQNDIKYFNNLLYKHGTKTEQDKFLLNFMTVSRTKSKRPRKEIPRNRKRIDYFIRKGNGNCERVCLKTFQSITQIGRRRLNGISTYFFKHGTFRPEKRGGSRISHVGKEVTESIIQHLLSLKCRESHYGRGKSIRHYLPPELSVRKLWKTWQNQRKANNQPICSYSKYHKIFSTKFNLGFGNPRTDVCSLCEQFKNKIKASNKQDIRSTLVDYRIHKLRAKKFYQLLKADDGPNVIKICFDMQQNQPLPKLSVGEVYYARQIWIYNLTIIIHENSRQDNENVFTYTCTENESERGCNEICSALYDFLKILEARYVVNKSLLNLRLYSDSYPSQNKNNAMMATLLNCVNQSNVFDTIEHIFPIKGHSYMPPDRVFGRLEKKLQKIEIITKPTEYHREYSEFSTVKIYNKDWFIYDFKSKAKCAFKTKLPFKIGEQKIFIYKKGKNTIGTKNLYSASASYHNIFKKGFTAKNLLNLNQQPLESHVSEEKMKDVKNLLQYANLDEEAKDFYDKIFNESGKEEETLIYGSEESEIVL